MYKNLFSAFIALLSTATSHAQPFRTLDYNFIGWYSTFITKKIDPSWSLHFDYQWRRDEWIRNWQQSLARVGVNYQINPNLTARAGYAWIETYAYGDYTINIFGKQFSEHRSFIMLESKSKYGRIHFTQRNKLEQRWIEQYLTPNSIEPEDWVFINRYRQLLRLSYEHPTTSENRNYYLAVMNETFIGFGENINQNVFDQNRFAVMPGIKLNNTIRIEAGYYNQVLQIPRRINQLNVFQHNNGIIANVYISL
jgi:hypothetical protein